MKVIKFKILDKAWTIRAMDKKTYRKKHGKHSEALTKLHKRRIDLNGVAGRSKETIIHELLHAYMSELCFHSAGLDEHSLEEVFAEIMAKHGKKLLDLSDKLYHDLKVRK